MKGTAVTKDKGVSSEDPRVFLGFGQPPLVSAAEWICNRFRNGSQVDCSAALLVVPTARAVQRLLQLLVRQAEIERAVFVPPQIVTLGEFPELLYEVKQELATDLCQQLAWSLALSQASQEAIVALFGESRSYDLEHWQPYAALIGELHRRLGNDVLSFGSVVRILTEHDPHHRELGRWQALDSIKTRYYKLLAEVGLWDRQAARNVAVRRNLCRTSKSIVLVGVADLNRGSRLMLEQVRDRVAVLVAAPRNLSDRFDEFGGLITSAWLQADIPFPCERLKIVDNAVDQAFAVTDYLSDLQGQFSADQVTIAVPDAEVQPQIVRGLQSSGIPTRDLKGTAIKSTIPVQLMLAIVEYLERPDYWSLATLVRHPDLFDYLCRQVGRSDWLPMLDAYQSSRLPDSFEIGQRNAFGESETESINTEKSKFELRELESVATLNRVFDKLSNLLREVAGPPRLIAEWTEPWCEILSAIYGDRVLDRNVYADRQTIEACREIFVALRDKQKVPGDWQTKSSASRALQMAIHAAADWCVVPPAQPEAIELTGWLDLPLDDAPVVIVTGMNDEHVPASEMGHLFLPDSLCRILGIVDNERRYARDAWAMTVINRVRQHVLFVAGRRDLNGDPKKPSRLLFADNDEVMARRAKAYFSFTGKATPRFWLADPTLAPSGQQLSIPCPDLVPAVNELSVTSFRDYIKCPYRFYLSRILRLETVADDGMEMDGRAFGNLAHRVLEQFGRGAVANSTESHQIQSYLLDCLSDQLKISFRGSRLPALRIQAEQLRMRLERFAPLQAQRAAEGWRIVASEQHCKHAWQVDGTDFVISGIIDRVDLHDDGRIAIWDYKTSDQGDGPRQIHIDKNGWKDLQLPLYRHLAKGIPALPTELDTNQVGLGYVLLPKSLDDVRFETLECSDDELNGADELARQIIVNLRRGLFWPPARKPPEFSEQYSGICQDQIFERFDLPHSLAATEIRV